MSDRAEVLADCAITDEEWAKLRPGMTSWDMSVCVALLASRAKPLADAARDLVSENERLRAALKPFADYAAHFPKPHVDFETVLMECTDAPNITFGDCRRAAELLKEVGNDG